jgi:hypothetical protein
MTEEEYDLSEQDEQNLRAEWQFCAQRLDSLHDEAWAIQTNRHERLTEIWLEVGRLRGRITAIAESGVRFDQPEVKS